MTLEDRVRRIEQQRQDGPLWTRVGATVDHTVPIASTPKLLSVTYNATSHQNRVALTWDTTPSPYVKEYDIWIQFPDGNRIRVYTSDQAPAVFDIGTSATGVCVAFIQTVMTNGQRLHIDFCPSVTFDVTE